MKEILVFYRDSRGYTKALVRTLSDDSDQSSAIPLHNYRERKATKDDIKRIAPGLYEAISRKGVKVIT